MRIFISFVFCMLIAVSGAQASKKSDVQAVEDYLRGLKTMQARFIQTSQGGGQVAGDFMLKRPGRMRFQYDAPLTDFIVADGLFIYYYDGEMKQQSNTLVSRSLADFFLRKDLKLDGDVKVTDIKRGGGLLQVTLEEAKGNFSGALVLAFKEKPLQLKKWRIVDVQGSITEIELFDVEIGMKLDRSLFKYYDPEAKDSKYN